MFAKMLCRIGLHQMVYTTISKPSTRSLTGRKIVRYSMCTAGEHCRHRRVEERLGPDEDWIELDLS